MTKIASTSGGAAPPETEAAVPVAGLDDVQAAPAAPSGTSESPSAVVTARAERAGAAGRRRMLRVLGSTARTLGYALAGLLIFGIGWHFASASSELPGPKDGLGALKTLLSDPFYDLGPNDKGVGLRVYISLKSVFTGFLLAALVGVPFGMALGSSKVAWQTFNPLVQVLRPVSPLAWYPIWLTILKDTPHAVVTVIFITALWPIILNTASGVAEVPHDQKNVALVFRFSRLTYVRHVLLPNAMPSIVSGLRLSMGVAWMVLVAVEMLSAQPGIGGFAWESYNTGNLHDTEAAIILIGVVGLLLDTVLLRLARRAAVQEVRT
ncbi:nitrate ABC transporter permease [Actinocorallia longicatena]|uniref:Nitrate ABC transporter permease n=1 Tax=Actinocorallia longicatena TaxID=111803 RepID=A0ABP6Q9I0_9ACTN